MGIVAGVGILGTQDLRFTPSCLNVAILGTQDLRFKPSCLNDEKGALVLAGGSDIGGTVGILGILMQDFDPPFFPKPSEFIKKWGKYPEKEKLSPSFVLENLIKINDLYRILQKRRRILHTNSVSGTPISAPGTIRIFRYSQNDALGKPGLFYSRTVRLYSEPYHCKYHTEVQAFSH